MSSIHPNHTDPEGVEKNVNELNNRQYVHGDRVWVKLRGYPWWPANVKSSTNVPSEILDQNSTKQIQAGSLVPVFFFGTHDYSLVAPDAIKPFTESFDELSQASSSQKFREAMNEATNPRKESKQESSNHNNAFKKKRGRPPKHSKIALTIDECVMLQHLLLRDDTISEPQILGILDKLSSCPRASHFEIRKSKVGPILKALCSTTKRWEMMPAKIHHKVFSIINGWHENGGI